MAKRKPPQNPAHLNTRVDPALADVLRGYADHFGRGLGKELEYAAEAWTCLLFIAMSKDPSVRSACPDQVAELDRLREHEALPRLREIIREATLRPAPPPIDIFAGVARQAL